MFWWSLLLDCINKAYENKQIQAQAYKHISISKDATENLPKWLRKKPSRAPQMEQVKFSLELISLYDEWSGGVDYAATTVSAAAFFGLI